MEKVLIANRGEIALRIIRACKEMGLQTVAVYSQADSESLHVLAADEAICIGKAPSTHSYLNIPAILSACEITGADAIHPGYGFLSESGKFAALCENSGLTFIGPSCDSIRRLGDKAEAKATAKKANCPVIPGTEGVVRDIKEALVEANKIGFPVFIKAVAGGGGKGIRIAKDEKEFVSLFAAAQTEAQNSFGNPDVYLEKMVVNPRHIEVQVVADTQGNVVHLFERDCTLQRRRQKLIEEAPSPVVDPELREKMGQAACRVAQEAGYYSVGTVEFLLDESGHFYFLEMNTRIQVEHTITEELTGIDIVRLQIAVAQGKPLGFAQSEVELNGHVIQFRINAEDPTRNFAPQPGKLEYYIPPGGPHVRLDSNCYAGYKIPPNYDSMIGKLIVKGKTREEAIQVGKRALSEFHIGGVATTIPFHLYMLENAAFTQSQSAVDTIDRMIDAGCEFVLN